MLQDIAVLEKHTMWLFHVSLLILHPDSHGRNAVVYSTRFRRFAAQVRKKRNYDTEKIMIIIDRKTSAFPAVDGRNPANHLGCIKPCEKKGFNYVQLPIYQPKLLVLGMVIQPLIGILIMGV